METKTLEITKKIQEGLKCVVDFAKDYYSTNHIDYILLIEPNTLQTFEIECPKIVKAIGNYRKVSFDTKKDESPDSKDYYTLTLTLK